MNLGTKQKSMFCIIILKIKRQNHLLMRYDYGVKNFINVTFEALTPKFQEPYFLIQLFYGS